eukprot:TRINITY_DN5714_c0_g1_i2.p1 TRINITY_DN5714_c0_g1~~TRINITY_DN5714_c0_g1_i2.p1  ORF type:complete len:199 (+),score=41.95 TRINITY_DN5714_c0_g1_i2:57-653(+)
MAANPSFDVVVKLLVLGNTGVGKSALLIRFSDGEFLSSHSTTLGIDFKVKTVEVDGRRIKLQIWDTAGQERFRAIATSYFRGVKGFLLVYDVSDRLSFEGVERWLKDIKENATDAHRLMIVANKVDLPRVVSTAEGQECARKAGGLYIETSAKDATNVDEAFYVLAKEAIPLVAGGGGAGNNGVKVDSTASKSQKKCC